MMPVKVSEHVLYGSGRCLVEIHWVPEWLLLLFGTRIGRTGMMRVRGAWAPASLRDQ
jgi:hypothetical protein